MCLPQANRRNVDRNKLEQAVEEIQHEGQFTGMFRINYDKLVDPKKAERMAQELFEAGGCFRLFGTFW